MTRTRMIAFAISFLILGSSAFGDDPSPDELLEKVAATYKDLKTYKSTGTITTNMDAGGMQVKTETSFSILLKKPNLFLISWTQKNMAMPGFDQSGTAWNDGAQSYLYMGVLKSYSKESDQMALAGATGISGGAAHTIPSLFLSSGNGQTDPFARLQDRKIETTEKIGGEDCFVLAGSSAISKKETFWISKKSSLIRKFERSLEPPEGGVQVPEMTEEQLEQVIESQGQEVTEEAKKNLREMMEESRSRLKNMKIKGLSTEVHSEVSTPDSNKDDFKFDPPEGTVLVDSLLRGRRDGNKELPKTKTESNPQTEAAKEKKGGLKLVGVPEWLKKHDFKQDKFTFVRIQYDSVDVRKALGLRNEAVQSRWRTDYPDADLSFAAQLGFMTKLDVSEPSRVLKLTDAALVDYPFVYLSEPGALQLTAAEIKSLRAYLLGGGFLMVDDFWGEKEWENLRSVMKQVFPDREPKDLELNHPLFHCVFDLKEKPQVTSIHHFLSSLKTERYDAPSANYRAILDDKDRVMVIMCHNTDLADGWERAADDENYRREMSIAKAFPMGINIVYYALEKNARK